MSQRKYDGHDYDAGAALDLPVSRWIEKVEKAKAAGGYAKRIGGDFSMFDAAGGLLFEVYEAPKALTIYLQRDPLEVVKNKFR